MGIVGFKVRIQINFFIYRIDKTIKSAARGAIGMSELNFDGVIASNQVLLGNGDKKCIVSHRDGRFVYFNAGHAAIIKINGQLFGLG